MSLTHHGWRRRVSVAAIGAATLVLGLFTAPAASAQDVPGTDEIVSSPNMKHELNIPPTAPLANRTSIGTDIAFQGQYAFVGNYDGFTIYDIKTPKRTKIVSQVLCPGGQNDISIHGNLLFLSTDAQRSDDSCTSTAQNDGTKPYWEGIKIFDVSDKLAPRYIKSVATPCGSHTHTLVPDKRGESVYVYVSSFFPADNLANCQPPLDSISIVEVPLSAPTTATIVATPVLFPDGGFDGPDTGIDFPGGMDTSGCHDVTVYPEKDLAAGACMGDGVLMDISDRADPRVIDRVQDDSENCVAHNGSLIPVPGKDIMVQAWYMGGLQVWDFTNSARPKKIGYLERGPAATPEVGGMWSAYYYNGYIYASDLRKGLDVISIDDPRTNPAGSVRDVLCPHS